MIHIGIVGEMHNATLRLDTSAPCSCTNTCTHQLGYCSVTPAQIERYVSHAGTNAGMHHIFRNNFFLYLSRWFGCYCCWRCVLIMLARTHRDKLLKCFSFSTFFFNFFDLYIFLCLRNCTRREKHVYRPPNSTVNWIEIVLSGWLYSQHFNACSGNEQLTIESTIRYDTISSCMQCASVCVCAWKLFNRIRECIKRLCAWERERARESQTESF